MSLKPKKKKMRLHDDECAIVWKTRVGKPTASSNDVKSNDINQISPLLAWMNKPGKIAQQENYQHGIAKCKKKSQ